MNTRSASGFCFLGLVMWILPAWAPQFFPANGIDGSSARELWVNVMAVVNATIGLAYLFKQTVLPGIFQWLADEPTVPAVLQPRVVPAYVFSDDAFGSADTLRGKYADLWRALKVAFVDEHRFRDFMERFRILAEGHRKGVEISRPAPIVFGDDAEHALVDLMQSRGINLRLMELRSRDWLGKVSAGSFLRQAADEVGEVMGNSRRAA